MLTPRFLEWMNGTLSLLCVCASVMFAIYMAKEVYRNGWNRTRLQAAISIFVFVSGEALIRGWVWWWRHLENAGADSTWMQHHPVLMIGAITQTVGVICVIRVFAPDSWGRYIWLSFMVIAVGIASVFLYI